MQVSFFETGRSFKSLPSRVANARLGWNNPQKKGHSQSPSCSRDPGGQDLRSLCPVHTPASLPFLPPGYQKACVGIYAHSASIYWTPCQAWLWVETGIAVKCKAQSPRTQILTRKAASSNEGTGPCSSSAMKNIKQDHRTEYHGPGARVSSPKYS